MIRALILAVFYVLAIGTVGLIGIPWTLITGRVDFLYNAAMRAARAGIRLVGIRVELRGLDAFDLSGNYIYMCNHVSNLDAPIVIPAIPRRTSVLVKKELFRVPILSRAMRLGQFVPVDRANRDAAIASVQKATEVLKSGVNLTVFPEGTRSRSGKLLPFKKGPFHLAMESQAPIIPMSIHGTETMMPKQGVRVRTGTAVIVFHAPIWPRDYPDRDALAQAVREKIASALPEWMRE